MPKPARRGRYTLEDLRIFLAVADAGSISGGAERGFLAPSSVSERMSALEAALGTKLLRRIQRGVRPTPAGRILQTHARRCLTQLEQLNTDLAGYSQHMRSQITLFATGTSLSSLVPRALETFFVANPEVDVDLFEKKTDQIIEAVASGRADLGVVSDNQHADLRFLPLCRDELVIICSPNHPLAVHESLRFGDCLDERIVGLRNDASFHQFIQDRARQAGRKVAYRVQVNEFGTLGRLVAAGAGIAIVPKSITPQLDKRLHLLPLNEPWAVRQLYLCMPSVRETPNPNADELTDHIRRQTQ
jgi:DNA-binding transcriptional LysR family regulator